MQSLYRRFLCVIAAFLLPLLPAFGQAPVFQATPNPVDFGVSPVGAGQPFPTNSFTITNTGSASMTVPAPTVLGDAADFCFAGNAGGCGTPTGFGTFPPGTSASATLRFIPQAPGVRTAQVTYTTNAAGSPNQVVITGVGVGTGDFGVGAPSGSSSATVTAGQTANFMVGLAARTGFNGTINLSCGGLPTGAACGGSNGLLFGLVGPTVIGEPISITTTGGNAALHSPGHGLSSGLFALLVAGLILPLRSRFRRHRVRASCLGFAALLMLASAMVSCGGSSSSNNPAPGPTPKGTFTVTVTGTSGNVTHSAKLTLIVQ